MKNNVFVLFLLSGCIFLLSSCWAELGAIGEGASLGIAEEGMAFAATERSLLSMSEKSLLNLEARQIFGRTISSEAVLTELENVKLVEQSFGKPPQLQFVNNSAKPFAEIINKRTIKFLDGKGEIRLHNDIYALKGEGINLRTSPTKSVSNVKRMILNENRRLVIKLDKKNGWYKVLIGRNEKGWIHNSLLLPVIIAATDSSKHIKTVSENSSSKTKISNQSFDVNQKKSFAPPRSENFTSLPSGSINDYPQNDAKSNVFLNSKDVTNDNNHFTKNTLNSKEGSDYIPTIEYKKVSEHYQGTASFSGNIEFMGSIQGSLTIEANSNFIIAKSSKIQGSIFLGPNSTLHIYGVVQGSIINQGGTVINDGVVN